MLTILEFAMHRIGKTTGDEWSGGLRNSLSALRTAGVIVGTNTEVMKASGELFRVSCPTE
jgi:hypothetical protein